MNTNKIIKIFALLLCILMMLSFFGCDNGSCVTQDEYDDLPAWKDTLEDMNKESSSNESTTEDIEESVREDILEAQLEYRAITGAELIKFQPNKYYATNGTAVDINSPMSNSKFDSAVVPCSEGNIFTITGEGGSTPRLWCFIKSDGTVIDASISSKKAYNIEITAPADTAYLVLNVINSVEYQVFKGRILHNLLKIEDFQSKDTIAKRVIVDCNGNGDYRTLHEAYAAITDSSLENQYEIIVFPGVYTENNLVVPPYTHTHGLHPNTVTITSEGQDGTLSVIEQRFASSKLSNLKIISHTKYCIHYDYALDGATIVNENLHLVQTKKYNNAIIGGGTFDNGAEFIWNNCVFENGAVHSHTSGSQRNYNNSHVVFNNCKLINAHYLAQSSGGFGHCVIEINGTNGKEGQTFLRLNLENKLRKVDEPWSYYANGCEWQILGAGNTNVLVEFYGNTGEGLVFEAKNENENIIVSGTAVQDLFGVIQYKKGGQRIKGAAKGVYLVKDEQSNGMDVCQMWKRLGDCSVNNKTLTVTVGDTSQTYIFDQNYLSAKTPETSILSDINATITIATLKKYVATEAWENVNLEEKQFVVVTDSNSILKGCAVTADGKNATENATGIYGIALDDGANGETIPVWIGKEIYTTLSDGEYGIGANGEFSAYVTNKICHVRNGIMFLN